MEFGGTAAALAIARLGLWYVCSPKSQPETTPSKCATRSTYDAMPEPRRPVLLGTAIRDLEPLHYELAELLRDLEFQVAGGIIRYVVDPSEIYAYAYPDAQFRQISLFTDDNDEDRRFLS